MPTAVACNFGGCASPAPPSFPSCTYLVHCLAILQGEEDGVIEVEGGGGDESSAPWLGGGSDSPVSIVVDLTGSGPSSRTGTPTHRSGATHRSSIAEATAPHQGEHGPVGVLDGGSEAVRGLRVNEFVFLFCAVACML